MKSQATKLTTKSRMSATTWKMDQAEQGSLAMKASKQTFESPSNWTWVHFSQLASWTAQSSAMPSAWSGVNLGAILAQTFMTAH